jgi:murein DD-endopeptidase MepM/ murein hydrolase activator NlpD
MPALILAAAIAATPAADERAIAHGRELNRQLLSGQVRSIAERLAPALSQALGGEPGLARFAGQVSDQLGPEGLIAEELVFTETGFTHYYRRAAFAKAADVTSHWVWAPDGVIVGLEVRPTPKAAATDKLNYDTKTRLRLPLDKPLRGAWYVAWGGRDPIRNYHVTAADQRFAYDFVVRSGQDLYAGDPTRNDSWFCWGTPVIAPAAGTVLVARDGVPDNVPVGAKSPATGAGNHVIIDHGEGERSLLAHFRSGSVRVKAGDRVEAGQEIGRCGNSGHSDFPHLHYHLQTGGAFGESQGLPAFFNDYIADGKPIPRGEPHRGQTVAARP